MSLRVKVYKKRVRQVLLKVLLRDLIGVGISFSERLMRYLVLVLLKVMLEICRILMIGMKLELGMSVIGLRGMSLIDKVSLLICGIGLKEILIKALRGLGLIIIKIEKWDICMVDEEDIEEDIEEGLLGSLFHYIDSLGLIRLELRLKVVLSCFLQIIMLDMRFFLMGIILFCLQLMVMYMILLAIDLFIKLRFIKSLQLLFLRLRYFLIRIKLALLVLMFLILWLQSLMFLSILKPLLMIIYVVLINLRLFLGLLLVLVL